MEGTANGATANGTVTVIVDSDRDGLTDAQEAVLGTSPTNPDTDGDGLTDKQEVDAATDPLVNQFTADPDKAGLRNAGGVNLATGLRAVWGFDKTGTGTFLDSSGNNFHGTVTGAVTQGAPGSGPVSRAASFPFAGSYLSISPNVINGLASKTQLTFSFWYKQAAIATPGYRTIFSHQLNNGQSVTIAYGIVAGLPRVAFIQDFANPASGSSIQGVSFVPRVGNDSVVTNPAMPLDDNEWHHILVTVNGNNKTVYVDGDFTTPSQSTTVGFSGTGTNTYLGKFSSFNTARGIEGELDQFLIYSRVLTAAELLALWNYDADGDGISNRDELTGGSDPFKYEGDVDRDGLTNAEEAAGQAVFNGVTKTFGATNKAYFDTDGDLFDDYWEAKYFYAGRVNPNNATMPIKDNPATPTVIEGDYDNDGLSNYQEMIYGTDPNNADTDGDGISDKVEAEYGSSPLDGSQKPLNPGDFYGDETLGAYGIGNLGTILKAEDDKAPVVTVRVGDPSDSHSERWRVTVGDKQVIAPSYGQVSDPVELALDPTNFYKVNVRHVGTDPEYLNGDDNGDPADDQDPDYDYWAAVKPGKGSPFILCDLDGLLKEWDSNPAVDFFNDVDIDQLGSKTAYLVPLDNFSWSASYSGGDAVGPKHRKIALNGRPLADEKPQQEEESDQTDEETYVDAFNLSLHHDTTFTYLPLAASDMVLQASASSDETGFSSRSGLKPNERLDLPFGVGWSSSLCSYIEVVETIGGDGNDPVAVNVVDEAGRPQRFGTYDFSSFFPWPSTKVDKKTYQNTLVRTGTTFTLRKKYGTTLTFAPGKAWFMYSSDRVDGSTTVQRHTYWRLSEARDRYGVRLQYDYDSAPGVPNPVSLIPRRISSPDREGQFLVIQRSSDSRRIESITDSRGNTTTFNYTSSANEYSIPGGFAGAWKLTGVTFADHTQTGYTYESAVETDLDVSDPENPRTTYHYHTNLKSATDQRGNTHTFSYGFDQSKRYWDSSINGTHAAVDLNRLPPAVKNYVENEIANRNQPGKGQWKTMYGMSRRIASVVLPGGFGTATFARQGGVDFGETVTFTGSPGTTVTDATGKLTVYAFEGSLAEIVDVDATDKSVSKEWMVYYLTSKIHHGGAPGSPTFIGTETYQFDPASGLSLWKSTDLSGNVTTWEFNDGYGAIPAGLPGTSATMTKWSDPTAKVDALMRRETYTYSGSFRVMDSINDPYGTVTTFTVDGLGNRKTKQVKQNGVTMLSSERFDHANQRHKAFQTGQAKLAFASVSGQAWEKDLTTSSQPDANGRAWRETIDPGGANLSTEHAYDFNNNRISTLDPRGNRIRFTYDKLNRLIETTYPAAGTKAGDEVTTRRIWYNKFGSKAAEIDEEGRYTIHHYDALNRRITTIRDMDGVGLPTQNADGLVAETSKGSATGNDLVTTFQYNAVGSRIRQTDPGGNVTRTFHDSLRRPVHVFTGFSVAEANTGDATGDPLAWFTSQAAASTEKTHTEFQYVDANVPMPVGGAVKGNPGSTAFVSSGFKPTVAIKYAAVRTAAGTADLRIYVAYDALYRTLVTQTQYEAGAVAVGTTTYGGVSAQKEALQTHSISARDGNPAHNKVTRTILDGLQRPVSVIDAFGTPLAATAQTIYASTGLIWKTIDAENRESETEYDGVGRVVKVWQPDPVSGVVNRTSPDDPLAGSPCTQTGYDKNGNVTVTLNPLGYRKEYEYDARNRRIVERHPSVTKTEIVGGQPVETAFQTPLVRTAYDGVGNTLSVTNARNHVTRKFYDPVNRVIETASNPVTGTPSADLLTPGANDIRTKTSYDPNGNPLEVLDGNGNATRNTYDRLNRLKTTATNPVTGQPSANPGSPASGDITVVNAYDDAGNLVQVTDGAGRVTGFRYDGLGRKTRTLWDEGSAVQRTEQATYDSLVLLNRIDPKLQKTGFVYDARYRLEDVVYNPDAGSSHPDNRHLTYDAVGNLLTVTYPNETVSRQTLRRVEQVFDKLSRLTEETSSGATHSHTLDKAGNRRTTTYAASGRFLASTYDKLNRLVTCIEKPTETSSVENRTTYGYDLSGNITRKVLPNNTANSSTFDALNRKLTEDTRKVGGGLVSTFDYSQPTGGFPSGYDKAGNVLYVVENYGHASVKPRRVTNSYDRVYRLATETIAETGGSTTVTSYSYDAGHNRTGKTVTGGSNPGTWVSSYGTTADGYNSNQLKSVTKGSTITGFSYDANGSRTIKQVGGVTTQTYAYDFENRLTQVTDTTSGTFAYTYDHRTRRVGRDESAAGGQNDEVSFSGGLSVQEYTGGASLPTVETIRGSDGGGGVGGVLYSIRGTNRSYNAYNSRGDVVSKTDQAGAITWQSSYEAFGKRTQEQGTTPDRQKANTKDEDAWGALNEGMRYRDLEFGVFLTRDPLGFVDGPNVYTYVRQNPWTYHDALGLSVGKWFADTFLNADTIGTGAELVTGADYGTFGGWMEAGLGVITVGTNVVDAGTNIVPGIGQAKAAIKKTALKAIGKELVEETAEVVLKEAAEQTLKHADDAVEVLTDSARAAKEAATKEATEKATEEAAEEVTEEAAEEVTEEALETATKEVASGTRGTGVDRMWAKEQDLIREGKPSRKWTPEQEADILAGKRPKSVVDEKTVEGAHKKPVKTHPELQADPDNITPKSFTEHRKKDSGEHSKNPKPHITDDTTTP